MLLPVGFGLNCEDETAQAFRMVGAEVDLVHLTDLFARRHRRRIADYQVLAMVGGFSYGDHVAGGLVLATRIRAHLKDDLAAFLAGGGRVLGICNGFQTLTRLGLLPGPGVGRAGLHSACNAHQQRAARLPGRLGPGGRRSPQPLRSGRAGSPRWTCPSRHGEGRFVAESDEALRRLDARGQLAAPLRRRRRQGGRSAGRRTPTARRWAWPESATPPGGSSVSCRTPTPSCTPGTTPTGPAAGARSRRRRRAGWRSSGLGVEGA